MTSGPAYDAVVVGAGPNGLTAAAVLARAGRSVLVLEAAATVGGGTRTAELTLPGFHHDVCSAIHPLGAASPAFAALGLESAGVRWLHPDIALVHPLDDGRAAVLHRSLEETARGLGRDGFAYRRLVGDIVRAWPRIVPAALGPLLRPPRHPLAMAGFGLRALPPATMMARAAFRTDEARALFAGNAGHAILPLTHPLTASFGVLLAAAGHVAGWPMAAGGSQTIGDGLTAIVTEAGGEVRCGVTVRTAADLPPARAVLFDLTPRQVAEIAGPRLAGRARRRYERFRYGPGACKVDYALSGPVPWRSEAARRAGTVHVGGTLEEITLAEAEVAAGRHPERPFVLVAQQSLVDPTRAPTGQHTLWAYCHVPHGSTVDVTDRIEAQIERFAPGFRDLVLARHVTTAMGFEAYNPSYVGGDIAAGAHDGLQLVARPFPSLHPYRTPVPGWFLCGASTPPGAGVHGMCGWHAAQDVLATVLR